MIERWATSTFQQSRKVGKNVKEDKINGSFKQVESLHLVIMQLRQKQKIEPVCHKWGKNSHYSSEC